MFTLKQLDFFILLAKCERIVDVASQKNISQSAISMAIKSLEEDVGTALFERIGKRLLLNDRGKLLLQEIEPSISTLNRAFENFSCEQLSGELNIASSVTISDYLMPKIISEYLSKNDNVKLLLKNANSSDVIKMLKTGVCDIGFIESNYHDNEISSIHMMTDELIIVSQHPNFKVKKEVYIDTLIDKKWVLREEGSGTRLVFLNAIAPIDKELNIIMTFEHTEAIINFLLLDENYISCLPRIAVAKELEEGKLFEVPIKKMTFERAFIMITRNKKEQTPLLEHFKTHVESIF